MAFLYKYLKKLFKSLNLCKVAKSYCKVLHEIFM